MVGLLLASDSPRRAALLAEGGFDFETVSPRTEEKFDVDLTLRELTMWNAIRKGASVARMRPDRVVLAADTLVALKGKVIGKPADFSEAARILRRLSGRTHEVCSSAQATQNPCCLAEIRRFTDDFALKRDQRVGREHDSIRTHSCN